MDWGLAESFRPSYVRPDFLVGLLILGVLSYLSWTFALVFTLTTQQQPKAPTSPKARLPATLSSGYLNAYSKRRSVKFSPLPHTHDFDDDTPASRRSGDVRRMDVDSLSEETVAEELRARNKPSESPEKDREFLKASFDRELRVMLSVFGLSPTKKIECSNVETGLRLDLARLLWRRAYIAYAGGIVPRGLSEAQIERQLDLRTITHDLSETPYAVKRAALEIAVKEEVQAKKRLGWRDQLEESLEEREGVSGWFHEEIWSELEERSGESREALVQRVVERDGPAAGESLDGPFDLLFSYPSVVRDLKLLVEAQPEC